MACDCAGHFCFGAGISGEDGVSSFERSAVLVRPVGYEHLFRSNCRLDGDAAYVRDAARGPQ
jgi:hypothetical protein